MEYAALVAAAIGAAIAVQVFTLGIVADRFNVLIVSSILQASGLVAGLVWTTSTSGWSDVAAITRTWWWVPLGILGWGLVGGLGYASSRIGVATTLAIALASQLAVGLGLDGATGIRVGGRALVGMFLLLGGTVLITTR